MLEIYIKYFDDEIDKIEKIAKGDWIDLRSRKNLEFLEDSYFTIPLGVAMQLPEGHEALLAPRSSAFKEYGIIMTNPPGVIDSSYNGDNDEWQLSCYAPRSGRIMKNERVAHFRIIENMEEVRFKEVDILGNEDRGGFGTTGTG